MPVDALDELVAEVRGTAKNRRVCEEYVRNIGARELARHRQLKAAIKSTKDRLHQVAGAYLAGKMDYDAWLGALRQATGGAALRRACREVMGNHASTRERLSIIDEFYGTVLAGLPPLQAVIDVASGLNPLAAPWLPLAPGAAYYAYDIYEDMMAFLGQWLTLAGLSGHAEARDVTTRCPEERADLALVLKVLPCLDQVDGGAALRLLDGLQADWLLVSFPVHSLGGRSKGMAATYEARFSQLIAGRDWTVTRFLFPTELAFLVHKNPS